MSKHRVRTIGGITIDDKAVTASQRPLVAALALSRRTGASIDTLSDAVWPSYPPPTAKQSIQNQIARLRHSFGADLIVTTGDRYQLAADTDVGEVDRLTLLCDRPVLTTTDARAMADLLHRWNGEPYADLPDNPAAQAERARLQHAHSRLIETLARHQLADPGADHHATIVDLTVRTSIDPLHEHAWELLVVALHLVGRRTEALRTYARFTEVLDREIGAEPSRRFQHLRVLVAADEPIDPLLMSAAASLHTPPQLRATA
jgi:DNA-binding SARP family transcriptional activator